VLIVPVFGPRSGEDTPDEANSEASQRDLAGVLEVLSPDPNAFSFAAQHSLEKLAREGARVLRVADHSVSDPPASEADPADAELLHSFESVSDPPPAEPPAAQPYRAWTIVLGALVILAAFAVTLLAGWRVGFWGSPALGRSKKASVAPAPTEISVAATAQAPSAESPSSRAENSAPAKKARPKSSSPAPDNPAQPAAGELVVYEKGKVIFHMKEPSRGSSRTSASAGSPVQHTSDANAGSISSAVVPASSNGHVASPGAVWLAPDQAEDRLVSRIEPQYPADALAARRTGSVVLEVVVGEDGKVSSVRTLIGDPILGAAAAEAVRNWRYEPYRAHERAAPFQTDVTLNFTLPN